MAFQDGAVKAASVRFSEKPVDDVHLLDDRIVVSKLVRLALAQDALLELNLALACLHRGVFVGNSGTGLPMASF